MGWVLRQFKYEKAIKFELMSHTQQQQPMAKRQSKTTAKKLNKENDGLLSEFNANHLLQQQQQSQSFEKMERPERRKENQLNNQRRSNQLNELNDMTLLNQESSINKSSGEQAAKGAQKVFSYHLQSDSVNTTNMGHQASLSHSFSWKGDILQMTDANNSLNAGRLIETLDSNGNIIRGRKVDSPQLVVVKELKDLEDQEEATMDNHILGYAFGSNRGEDDLIVNWNLRDKSNSENKRRNGALRGGKDSKSLENKHKAGVTKTNPRDGKNRKLFKDQISKPVAKSTDQSNVIARGVKSTRDIRSSLGFHELLNQLDKDVSIQQQSNQIDFKNRTAHDLLRLELSAIRKQNNSNVAAGMAVGAQGVTGAVQSKSQERAKARVNMIKAQQNPVPTMPKVKGPTASADPKSKSLERKQTSTKPKLAHAVMPKSILKKNQEQGANILMFKQALSSTANAAIEATPDRNQNHQGINGTSFLQSEHGRCQTSQVTQPNQSHSIQNGRTNSHQNTGSNHINIIFSKIKNNLTQQINQANGSQGFQRASPDRVKEFRHNGQNIDRLIRDNIKKVRSKEDEEKLLKYQADENQRKKRDWIEYKNNLVRKVNKEKVYKKQQLQLQQVSAYQLNQILVNQVNQQQAQDDSLDQREAQLDEKMAQVNRNIVQREKFIQKSSQSQKIDFEKIKESSKGKKLSVKNHRKSYGLEFIDIKREIQEELRTIDLKFKNKELLMPDASCSQIKTLDNTQKPPKKLKIKPQMIKKTPKPDETLPLSIISNGDNLNNYVSERMQPVNRVLVVKKSKIRKFMKKKKKTLFIKQLQEQKEQILKIIKMQENQSKLNQYCKKNLEKHLQKKRNATLQYQPQQEQDEENQEGAADHSRLSGRRITFDNIDKQKHIYEVMRDQQQRNEDGNDSSRLSTDFYEEYFRLINSIKKEQQASDHIHQSRADISSQNVTSKSLQNLLKSPINNSQSPIGLVQTTQISAFSPKPGDNSQQSQTQSRLKKKAKSKSNLKHAESQMLQSTNQKSHSINTNQRIQSISKNTIKTVGTADMPKLNMRAESAPLMIHQSLKKKSAIKNSPQRKQQSPNKDSKEKPKKVNKKKQSGIEISQEPLLIPKKDTKKSRSEKKKEEEVAFRYFLNCVLRIQRSFRAYLLEQGFYDSFVDNDIQQSLEQQSSSEKEYQTQIFNGGDNTIFDQEGRTESPEKLLPPQVEEYEDESDYDEEEAVNLGGANMIIIDQKDNVDQQKKVVYMSNINSYSVPESPKGGDNTSPNQNLLSKGPGEGAKKKAVFEYKPGMIIVQPSQFFSQSLSATDQIHQQISQKPSLESNLNSESGQLPVIDKQSKASSKEHIPIVPLEEIKEMDIAVNPTDYQMRLFMGSESLLREFKHNTPKQHNQRKDVGDIGQRESVLSNKTDSRKSQSVADQTSHSSQSVFERNSFQQFTMQKLQQMMNNNEYMNLIEMREKALEYRKSKEKKFIRKMLKDKKFSPRTYTQRKEQLEKWVQVEKEEIQRTKTQFKAEWQKTVQMIEDTQKNVEQMRVKIDNRFNSANSSRNSQSSYMTNKPDKPRKSILEQEEYQPLSQRSMRMSICSQITIEQNKSVNHQLQGKANHANEKKLVIQDKLASDSSQPASSDHQRDNLMDFLEKSWQKTQLKQSHLPGSIYVEDQKEEPFTQVNAGDSYTPIDSEDLPLNDPYHHLDERASEIDRHSSEKRPSVDHFLAPGFDERFEEEKQRQHIDQIIQEDCIIKHHYNQNERSLVRSRSEQDLSDLIRNNQINFNDLDISDQNLQRQGGQLDHEGDLFVLKKKTGGDIKIQENLFDDSSHHLSKGKNFYQESQDQQQSQHEHDDDSLLNESQLNNYFQDQKFSIEDFKSLDKKKIIDHAGDLHVSERLKEGEAEGTDRQHRQQRQDDSSSLNEMALPANGGIVEQSAKEVREDEEPSFSMLQRPGETVPRVITPEHVQQTAFLQHQQAFLFQNTRPGENIKISDILKKTQNLTTDAVVVSSFVVDSSAAAVFQNQHINQSMSMPALQPLITGPELQLHVDAITEEILAQLLVSEIKVPKREIVQAKEPEQQTKPVESVQKIEPDSQAGGDVFMIDSQQSEKEMRREMIEYRQRMVIEQDLIRVENYINEVIHSLQQSELTYLTMLANNIDPTTPEMTSNYHRSFLNVLTQPIKRQELEILNQLQTSEIGSYDHFETAQDLNTNPILPIDLYLEIERQREEAQLRLMYINGQQEVDLENSIIQESSHIHNKGIFDALNESLMKFRPYGIQGEPMPWSNKNRRLQTKVDTNSVDTERLFMMVKQDVLRWAQVFSGSHPSPIFICKKQENQDADVFDEELFQETRERRLAQMLAADVVENEHQWLNYEFEEAQVKVDLSDMILEHLVEEITLFLNFKQDLLVQQPQVVQN